MGALITEEIKFRGGSMLYTDAVSFFGMSQPTLNHIIKTIPTLSKTTHSPGHPVKIVYAPLDTTKKPEAPDLAEQVWQIRAKIRQTKQLLTDIDTLMKKLNINANT